MTAVIIHVDMDAFFAAIEQRERPELAGRPVVVGADPRGRGVVSTCNYEARKYGVHSAMPIREAYRRCPGAVFLPVRMQLYADTSAVVMEVLGRFSPLVEPLSIDEAFLDASGCEPLFGPPETMARRIKAEIRAATGLPCSVGIAPNKFLAKLATELGKPDGLTVIWPEKVREVLEPLPVGRVFGVGKQTSAALSRLGISTVGELAKAPADRLARALGPAAAAHVQSLARGEDERQVEPHRLPKQLGSERTFEEDITGVAGMRRHLLDLSWDVGAGLRRHGYRTRAVRLRVRTEDFATFTRTRQLGRPTDSARILYGVACQLLEQSMPSKPVRLLGVTASELVYGEEGEQQSLFGPPEEQLRAERVEKAADRVRARFGASAIRPAALLDAPGKKKRPE